MVPTNRDSIFNGGFDSSAVAWDLQLHGDAQAIGDAKDGKYQFNISAIGTQNYQVQLIQHDLHLEKGEWYEISFDASAGAARTLEVNVEQHNDPWESYLTKKQNFELGTDMKTYSFKFQMPAETDTNSRLSFNSGAATGTLTLDNVKMAKLDASQIPVEDSTTALVHIRLEQSGVQDYAVFSMNGALLGRVIADKAGLYEAAKNLVKRSGMFVVKSDVGVIFRLNVK